MSHGEFIKRLNKGIEGHIKAYFEDAEGCLLYLSRDDTIYVPSMHVEKREDELLDLLREAIRAGVSGQHNVTLASDILLLQPCSSEDSTNMAS
ncbi:hypothetical protein [Pusillimonas sp.]|uniref:hypothetical protein n=1 Tax=Pusillimonas sp. TaxID=3040095 RepID=UPI0037C5359A